MTTKFRFLTLCLVVVSYISCSFSQGKNESHRDNMVPELSEYPVVEIDRAFDTPIMGEKIIIPEGIIGFVYVVFDSPQEKDYSCCPICESDAQNNLIVDIPKSKVLRYACDGKIHEKMLVEGKLQYFKGIYDERGYLTKRDSINRCRRNENLSIKMNGYQFEEYLSIKSALEKSGDKVDFIYDMESIVVVPYGFHESFKKGIETSLNKKISGNVAAFQIGSVKDIFN